MKLPLITFEHGRPKVVRAETVQLGGDIKLYHFPSSIPLILDQGLKKKNDGLKNYQFGSSFKYQIVQNNTREMRFRSI